MNLKEKIEDWWDDQCCNIRNIRGDIRNFFLGLHRWFSYYKVVSNIYDSDYSSILEVEKYQITRTRDAILKNQIYVGCEHDIERMNLALKLLNIIREDGCSKRVGESFKFEPTDNNLYKLVDDPNAYYTIPVYVNTSNSKQYLKHFKPENYEDPKVGNLWKDRLRVSKAWHIYNRLRTQCLQDWWY